MQNPDSPPKFKRTCPACNRAVGPGYKFCETCGTRIPELSTCSKCGTRFITPVKYCNLCGGPIIVEEVPEPVVSPADTLEENTGPDEGLTSEPDEDEIPEPDLGEFPEDNGEKYIRPSGVITPHHYKEEIQEPETDELLEQYGGEYGEDETLESFPTHRPESPIKYTAKKAFTVPSPPGRTSSESVDEALFLSPGEPGKPAKPRVKRTRIIGGCIALMAIVAVVYFIGLPILRERGVFSAHNNSPAAEITPPPNGTITQVPTGTPTPSSRALIPLPTQTLPPGQNIHFYVQKNPITSNITVIFTGSGISSADIKVSHPEGSYASGIILPLKGTNEVIVDGSQGTDRVEIIARMSDGKTYRVYDQLISGIRAI
jgi:hypothetical protein